MWNPSSKLYLFLVCLVGPAQPLFSQAGVASLSGRVLDPSTAIVSGATVTATNQGTKITHNYSPAATAANGVTYPKVVDPATGVQFPDNIVPANRIGSYGQKLLNLFPLPNQRGQVNNFVRTGALVDDTDSYDTRVDWNANDKNLIFVRYTGSDRIRDIPGYLGGIADGTALPPGATPRLNPTVPSSDGPISSGRR